MPSFQGETSSGEANRGQRKPGTAAKPAAAKPNVAHIRLKEKASFSQLRARRACVWAA